MFVLFSVVAASVWLFLVSPTGDFFSYMGAMLSMLLPCYGVYRIVGGSKIVGLSSIAKNILRFINFTKGSFLISSVTIISILLVTFNIKKIIGSMVVSFAISFMVWETVRFVVRLRKKILLPGFFESVRQSL